MSQVEDLRERRQRATEDFVEMVLREGLSQDDERLRILKRLRLQVLLHDEAIKLLEDE